MNNNNDDDNDDDDDDDDKNENIVFIAPKSRVQWCCTILIKKTKKS